MKSSGIHNLSRKYDGKVSSQVGYYDGTGDDASLFKMEMIIMIDSPKNTNKMI